MTDKMDDDVAARIRTVIHLERRHGYQSVIRHEGARSMMALLALIVGILVVLLIVQQAATSRRTASTPVQVVDRRLQIGSNYEQSPTGTWIRYEYVVDGLVYQGYDFRRWLDIPAYEPKVCFDPKNPADHLLVKGWTNCGATG